MGIKGLFVNNIKAQDSIYESGIMVFNCLRLSVNYQLDYIEVDSSKRTIPLGYDFYFFNYHPGTMPWLDTSALKKIPALLFTMVLEVLPNDPFVMCPDHHFHAYCVLDPTVKVNNPRVFPFPRPLDHAHVLQPYVEKEVPVIGSFGFATRGKGFQHVVDAVNKEFERAVIRINIPFGNFVPDSEQYSNVLEDMCRQRAKPGIEVVVTHDYMNKQELIDWCSQNTLNCFLYDRNMPGLAATTDQAIVAGRPLSVSKNDTFRHVLAYLPPYSQWSLKESIEKSSVAVQQMQQDWSQEHFMRQFQNILNDLLPRYRFDKQAGHFEMPLYTNSWQQQLAKRYRRLKRLLSVRTIKKLLTFKHTPRYEELI
jgi:hypothetical protein